jgi:hypothetical protein
VQLREQYALVFFVAWNMNVLKSLGEIEHDRWRRNMCAMEGNRLSIEEELRKLELVTRVAREVWGA